MRKFNALLVAFSFTAFLCMVGVPAQAFKTPAKSAEEIAFLDTTGKSFQSVATKFGCTDFAWANISAGGQMAQLEYVPKGNDVNLWTKMSTITVYSLTGKQEEDAATILKMESALLDTYKRTGKILNTTAYSNVYGEPILFVEYEIGNGVEKEHSAGLFMRTSNVAAAFIQVQSRNGVDLSKDDFDALMTLVPQKQ